MAAKEESKQPKPMWERYQVEHVFTTPFAASLPKNFDEIRAMLENRQASVAQFNKMLESGGQAPKTMDELAEDVAAEVQSTDEPESKGWATFKRDDTGLYYEGRCVRGHLKDCAGVLGQKFIEDMKAFKPKLTNRLYDENEKIYVYGPDGAIKTEVDGSEVRFVHAMTRLGMRNSIKAIEFVNDARIIYVLRILNDGVITEDHLRTIYEYGAIHGMGQERGMGWGRYTWTLTKLV